MSLDTWLAALDERHLADLTPSEVARALRALSSCYVERREKLERGGALDSAGKRAAFALFYAPLHFFVTREIVQALPRASEGLDHVIDLGCGTGSAGAAWAIEAGARVSGFDRNAWAIGEASWTYRQLAIVGRAAKQDIERSSIRGERGVAVLAAYSVNELPEECRAALLPRLVAAHEQGARVLVIEPIARRLSRWWTSWQEAFLAAGGSAQEWRFRTDLPARQRALARAAGLDPRELTAKSLFMGSPSLPASRHIRQRPGL
jgi:SAM-dependent methyltransferase